MRHLIGVIILLGIYSCGISKNVNSSFIVEYNAPNQIEAERHELPAPLKLFQINPNLPSECYGKKNGLVYQSEYLFFKSQFGFYASNLIYDNQFQFEIISEGNENNPLQLIIRSSPIRTDWTYLSWKLPPAFQNKNISLRMINIRPYAEGIDFSFSEPIEIQKNKEPYYISNVILSLVYLIMSGMIFLIVGLFFTSFFNRKNTIQPNFTFPIVVISSLVISYLVFPLYLIHNVVGISVTLTIILCSILYFGKYHHLLISFIADSENRTSILLLFCASVISISSGFLFNGWETPIETAQCRYLGWKLPIDNLLPLELSQRLFLNHPLQPFAGIWLSSDRPPLQTAAFLFQRSFSFHTELHYQIFSVFLQSLLIPLTYNALRLLNVTRLISLVITIAILFTPTFILNSFYVWPKLLPAGLLIFITSVLLFDKTKIQTSGYSYGIILGVSSALSMLSHGGSLIALVPIFFVAIIIRHFWKLKLMSTTVVSFLMTMSPWILYQKLIDPPGNRLIRWHIAGYYGDETESGMLSLIFSQYQKLSINDFIQSKIKNIETIFGNWDLAFMHFYPFQCSNGFHLLRTEMFSSLLISVITILPIVLLIPFKILKNKNINTSISLFVITAFAIVFWCLIFFNPGATFLHQGTYYIPFALMISILLPGLQQHPKTGLFLLLVHIISVMMIWVLPYQYNGYEEGWIINQLSYNGMMLLGFLFTTLVLVTWSLTEALNSIPGNK